MPPTATASRTQPIGPLPDAERERTRRLVEDLARPAPGSATSESAEDQSNPASPAEVRIRLDIESNRDCGPLPEMLRGAVLELAQHLAAGRAVHIVPLDRQLTTTQAANLLGVSRPYLVKLLEDGEIPYVKHNRHRRVGLDDLLAYRDRLHAARQNSLDQMYEETAALGLYE